MAFSAEALGKPSSEVIVIGGQPIEVIGFAGQGLLEAVSNLRKLNLPNPEDTPDLQTAA